MNEHVDVLSTEATNTVACNEEATNEVIEEWRPVVGFTGSYLISNLGRVQTLGKRRSSGGFLQQKIVRGYTVVTLLRPKEENYKHVVSRVDALVYSAFVGPLKPGDLIEHIDGNVQNNNLDNLRAFQSIIDPSVCWLPVVGYEDHYEISSRGEVRSKHTGQLLYPKLDRYGYLHLGLRYKTPRKWFTVHRLVAEAFIPNPENKETVDHINGNKLDNRPENLRWATPSENFHNPVTFSFFQSQDFKDLKKRQQAHLNKAVVSMCADQYIFYSSLHEAQRQTGKSHSAIQIACERFRRGIKQVAVRNGKQVVHWRWATPEEIAAQRVLLCSPQQS